MKKTKTWSVPRVKSPLHPKFTVRVAEYTPGGTLHAFLDQPRQATIPLTRVPSR